jgi:Transglutaminase-like superfamily
MQSRSRWQTWRRLSGWTRFGFLFGSVTMPFATLIVRHVPFKFYRFLTSGNGGRHTDKRAHDIARGLTLAARRSPVGVRCLAESLTVASVLRVIGYNSRIVVGVVRPDESFGAHAWVEIDEVVVGNPLATTRGFRKLDLAERPWRV